MQWRDRIKSVGGLPLLDLIQHGADFFKPSTNDIKYSELQDINWTYSYLLYIINKISSIPKDNVDNSASLLYLQQWPRFMILEDYRLF